MIFKKNKINIFSKMFENIVHRLIDIKSTFRKLKLLTS